MSNNNEIEDKFYEENKDSNKCLVFIRYNPYISEIKITINKENLARNSELNIGKRSFESWIEKIPTNLFKENPYNKNFKIAFQGSSSDYNNLKELIEKSKIDTKKRNIELCYYPIQTFDDKLKIINQIFKKINTEKELFSGEIVYLSNNFHKDWNNKNIDRSNLIISLSKNLKDMIKSYREAFQNEEEKLDNSISSINTKIESLKEELRNKQNDIYDIIKEIEEFKNNFPKKTKEIQDKYIIEFDSEERKKQLAKAIFKIREKEWSYFCNKAFYCNSENNVKNHKNIEYDNIKKECSAITRNDTSNFPNRECKFKKYNKECYIEFLEFYDHKRIIFIINTVYREFINYDKDNSGLSIFQFLTKFREEINDLVEERFKKWKNDLSYDLFFIEKDDNLCLGSIWNFFNDLLSLEILEIDFRKIEVPLRNFFSNILSQQEKEIEYIKEEIKKSYSNLTEIKNDIKSKEEEIKEKKEEKQKIQSKIEILKEIEKQADSLIEI